MRIIKDFKRTRLPSDSAKRFFIQSWFSLIHMNSLDSHRVRCMNTINIIDELADLISLSKSNLPNIKDEIVRVANEACEIINNDQIVQEYFGHLWQNLEPLLNDINQKKSPSKVLSYFLNDFQADLDVRYKGLLIDGIKREIYELKNYQRLFMYVGALLSILIHDGHSLAELFAIVRDIFISNKSHQTFSFDDNFEFVLGIINRKPSQYNIIFRLQGCQKYDHLKTMLGERISEGIEINSDSSSVRKFLSPGQNVLFAKFGISAQDDRSAGLLAKKELDSILDLIRFELEHSVISVEDEFISIRSNERAARRFRLPSIIPNPAQRIDPQHFENFVDRFNRVFQNDKLNSESKEKIRSALRFYRMGRDSDLFENKFLNWWTALEFLTRTGEKGGIIDEVKGKLMPILLLHYLEKHLISYRNAMVFCGIRDVDNQTSAADLFTLIHDSEKFPYIFKQIEGVPFLQYKISEFKSQTIDAKVLRAFLERHEKHLKWHIHRIWRVRCDIVHSAEYSLNLNLLSANLEYYLKSLLTLIIDTCASRQSICSINELFERYQHAYEHLREEMEKEQTDLHNSMLAFDL